ncbi:MAG: hypothetical protein HOZ81_13455 [Streptomyces sp.]|nr:hypothetical protein [Streptomyces sp.]
MTALPRRPDTPTGIVIRFELHLGGRYVTAECQLGAHHACPGGLRDQYQQPYQDARCRCIADGCACMPKDPDPVRR